MKFLKSIGKKKKRIARKIESLKKDYQEAYDDAIFHYCNKCLDGYNAAHARMHKANARIQSLRKCIA